MQNTEPNPQPAETTAKCPSCERRKKRLHRWMRRVERTLEIASIFIHLYIIGEAAEHAYFWAFAAVA